MIRPWSQHTGSRVLVRSNFSFRMTTINANDLIGRSFVVLIEPNTSSSIDAAKCTSFSIAYRPVPAVLDRGTQTGFDYVLS